MNTRKLISTISYNSELFLQDKLNELVKLHIIEYGMIIHHEAEEDELKSHFHVLMCPCGTIDTVKLREQFIEVDVEHPDRPPLGCITIMTTKRFDDWYLYAIHHRGYLMSKGENRVHHYTIEDIWCTDSDLLNSLVEQVDMSKYRCYEAIFEAVEDGVKFSSLVANGVVPLGWIYQFRTLYDALREDFVYRNGKDNHDKLWLKGYVQGGKFIPYNDNSKTPFDE